MPMQVSYVESLEDVLVHAVGFLGREGGLFARPRIVVPTPGAKAWLSERLARLLGAAGREDGIFANVEMGFPGMITALLQPARGGEPDPWSFDRMMFAVLDVITGPAVADLDIPFDHKREPLLAARRIAGLFDNYHVRRPGMILEWERSGENRVLSPTANDEQQDGIPVPGLLRESDQWQFELWRAVRRQIDQPSPPARMTVDHLPSRDPLLVAGLELLTLPQLECLKQLGRVCDVEVLLVHPSPGLRTLWSSIGQQPLPEKLLGRPLLKTKDQEFPEGVDQMLPVWLAGTRDLQELVTAEGVAICDRPAAGRIFSDTLLGRMQRTVASGAEAEPQPHDRPTDRSVVIHRCHSLSRQAEVLHDALLQAFEEIEDLQPHDVAIVSPCIEKAAPHLEAVFQRTVDGRDKAGKRSRIKLPLVVADRGIRQVDEGVELLVALLALPGSRCSLDDILEVAGDRLVEAEFDVDDDTVASWADFAARTAVRWGLDASHRTRHGLTLPAASDVHTWKLGLERMLLGAMLPDGNPQPELGGVVPLADLDPVDLISISKLLRILEVIRKFEAATVEPRPVADWCDAIEQALVGLCGEECPQFAEPLSYLRRLRQAAAGTAAELSPVPFEDVRRLLVAWFDEKSGRQPYRTGAITATSMVPLRGVPFKVICVVGYDDGAVGASEAEADDLVARQQFVGDVDPRADERRALLDCLLAAGERLLITCNGRSVKTNQPVPLVTPLAEFVDFAVRHGVRRDPVDERCGIEIEHPRHHLSRKNFLPEAVQPGTIWSHDATAAKVAGCTAAESDTANPESGATLRPAAVLQPPPAATVEISGATADLSRLERMVKDPLGLYLKETLGIDTWRDDEQATPATLPLTLERKQIRDLTLELLHLLFSDATAEGSWVAAVRQSGRLPVGPHGDRQLREIITLANGLKAGLDSEGLCLASTVSVPLADVALGRHRLVGTLAGVHRGPNRLVFVTAGESDKDSFGRPLHMAALRLLVARAAGIDVEAATLVSRRDGWKLDKRKEPSKRSPVPPLVDSWQVRIVRLEEHLMPAAAAAGHLDEIALLADEASTAPRPAFGKVATTTVQNREKVFEEQVGSDGYARSSESVMFGVSPHYRDVFTLEPARLLFLDAFQRLLQPEYNNRSKDYRLA